jgi:hypothetical protein
MSEMGAPAGTDLTRGPEDGRDVNYSQQTLVYGAAGGGQQAVSGLTRQHGHRDILCVLVQHDNTLF